MDARAWRRGTASVRVWEIASPGLPPVSLAVGDGPVLAVGFAAAAGELRVATPHLLRRSYPLAPDRAADAVCERAGGGATAEEWRTHLPGSAFRRTC
jgi:hypothetical protein